MTSHQIELPEVLTHEQKIMLCVGHLVAEWANCETLLRGIYVCLTGGASQTASDYAEVTWLSMVNVRARCDLLSRSVRASPLPAPYKKEAHRLLSRFDGATRTRNLYCHAHYVGDPDTLELVAIESYDATKDDRIIKTTRRSASGEMLAELKTAIRNCGEFSREAAGFLLALRELTGARFPELPDWPGGHVTKPNFERVDKSPSQSSTSGTA